MPMLMPVMILWLHQEYHLTVTMIATQGLKCFERPLKFEYCIYTYISQAWQVALMTLLLQVVLLQQLLLRVLEELQLLQLLPEIR